MWNASRLSLLRCLLVVGVTAFGCGKRPGLQNGTGGIGLGGVTGAGGAGGGSAMRAACAPSDARLVVAPQRILRLTMTETLNTVRYLIRRHRGHRAATRTTSSATTATASNRVACFLPCNSRPSSATNSPGSIGSRTTLPNTCSPTSRGSRGVRPATDACATAYLNKLAARAYRRPLTWNEQARFTALYTKLRSTQTVNGYEVTFSVEEATQLRRQRAA